MESKKKNLAVVGLDANCVKELVKKLALSLDMLSVDALELIEYNLIDKIAMLSHCGIDYLQRQEKKAILSMMTYENAVISVDYDLFNDNFDIVKNNAYVIYTKVDKAYINQKNDILNVLAFEERNIFLNDQCDLVIDVDFTDLNTTIKNIMNILGGEK